MKRVKRIFSVFLTLLMMVSIIPMSGITPSAATTAPPVISESEVSEKINKLYEILGEDSLFTTTRTATCGVKSTGHGCDYCKLSEIIEQEWFIDEFGTTSISQYPNTYNSSGKAGGPDGSSCFGFATFAEWYVFSTKETDKVTTQYVGTFPSNYENAATYIKAGDLIRFGSRHSGIAISCDSNGVLVLDSNWGIDGYNCQVKLHNVRYSFCDTFTISRASNSFAVSSTPTPPPVTCDCSTSYAGEYTCTTKNATLNIRAGHGTSYSIIGSIPEGATVSVSKADGTWAHVTYNGTSGYASMSYLQKISTKTIYSSVDSVNLTLGGTENQVIYVWTEGSYDNSCSVQMEKENSKIDCTLGTINSDNKMPLTISAKETGTSTIKLSVKDDKTGEVLHSIVVNVSVNAKTYTVSYNANGGSGAPSKQTKTHGTELTLSSVKPTRTGYTFLGWSTSRTATTATYLSGGKFTTDANTTLYAVWQKDSETPDVPDVPDIPDKPDIPDTPDAGFTFSIKEPTTTIIRYKNEIILQTEIQGDIPENSRIEWTWNNENFDATESDDDALTIISKNNGKTVFTATLHDADGSTLATDEIEMQSKAGFFDKLIYFFRILFGGVKV